MTLNALLASVQRGRLVRASQSLRDHAHLTAAPLKDERESFLLLRLCEWIKPIMII